MSRRKKGSKSKNVVVRESSVHEPLAEEEEVADKISEIFLATNQVKKSKEWKGLKFNISKKQKKDIKEAFDLFDADGYGLVETNFLKVAFRALGIEPSRKDIRNLEQLPRYLSYEEFLEQLQIKMTSVDDYSDILKMFHLFDIDHSGKIKITELERVAKELGEDVTEEELNEMLDEGDISGNRYLEIREFKAIMQRLLIA
ncbi:hypothetical protein WA026_013085 [Henosepilachna vigintioctopunctata]|uniref:EF-hand domain-containing protein n=1 Tax=Henosepilachna vigintioctopunctata TaxID=420089 RepID=A0AAW1UDN2_9CUCU